MVVVGAQPRPRLLAVGLDDAVVEQIRTVAPTVRALEGAHQLGRVRQSEYDIAVIRNSTTDLAAHLFFVAEDCAVGWVGDAGGALWTVEYRYPSVATEFVIGEGPDAVQQLVRADVLPLVQGAELNSYLTFLGPGGILRDTL